VTRRLANRLALTALAVVLAGCHTIRFEIAKAPTTQEPVVDRKTFWFYAVTSQDVDVRKFCPHGVVAIDEEITFTDGLFGNLTLGIYTPRTSYYWCRLPPTQGGAP
jgi:hypothetical protein